MSVVFVCWLYYGWAFSDTDVDTIRYIAYIFDIGTPVGPKSEPPNLDVFARAARLNTINIWPQSVGPATDETDRRPRRCIV